MSEKNGRLVLGEDGKYRWTYRLNLYKNLSVFFTVWKIFFFIIAGGFAVVIISDAARLSDFYPNYLVTDLKVLGYFLAGMTAISLLSYYIYAAIMGGEYIVEFEMDKNGVLHRQIAAQAKKAKKIGKAAALSGAASGSLTAAGAGMSAQRTEMYSDFSKVKKVKAYPARGLIKVNETLGHNRVYAAKEDFAFVKGYIISHCDNIRK